MTFSNVILFSDPKIEEYLNNVIVQENDGFYVREYFSPSEKSMSFQSSSLDDQISESGNFIDDIFNNSTQDYNLVNNANLLKDIESLIQNMEKKQTRDNESTMLDNIDSILSNIKLNESRPHSPQSNLSAEPIRIKSPIMLRKQQQQEQTSYDIMDDIRHFVTNNIQDIVPDLVNQVELEITRDLVDNLHGTQDTQKNTTDENVDSFFDVDEFMAVNMIRGNLSPDLANLEGHDDFLRNRQEEEFEQINDIAGNLHKSHDQNEYDDDEELQEFFLARHNAEYEELNDELHKSQQNIVENHDSISESITIPTENVTKTQHNNQQQIAVVDDGNETKLNNASNLELQTETEEKQQQQEPLKYKSSFNLKILKQPKTKRRTRSEREFKKRNSLIFENVLLGKSREKLPTTTNSKNEDETIAASTTTVAVEDNDLRISLGEKSTTSATENVSVELNGSENHNISQYENEIIEVKSDTNLNVNAHLINENVLATTSQISLDKQEIETTSVVEIIINDEIQQSSSSSVLMNDDLSHEEKVDGSLTSQSLLKTSANASESDLSTKTNAQQNLSELVEDTQRLIKQMKDEINAIYLSDEDDDDDDLTIGSEEESEYSDEWVDGEFIEEEEDEESEYEDWSGGEEFEEDDEEFVEEFDEASSENFTPAVVNDQQQHININENENPIIQIFTLDDTATLAALSDNNEPLSNDVIVGNNPDDDIAVVVSNTESVEVENIVHGKLEIQPAVVTSSSHNEQQKQQNNIINDAAVGGNEEDVANALNLNNALKDDEASQVVDLIINNNNNEEKNNKSSKMQTQIITATMTDNSSSVIKMIVNEAINDVISAVVDTNEITSERPLTPTVSPLTEHNSTIINNAMNNIENIPTEIMAKVSHQNDVDDSITSGNVLSDENEIINVISLAQQNENEENVNVNENVVISNNDEVVVNGSIEKSNSNIQIEQEEKEKSKLTNVADEEESVRPLIIEKHSGENDVRNENQILNDSAPMLEKVEQIMTKIDEKITENNETKSPSTSADILMSDETSTVSSSLANNSNLVEEKSSEKIPINTGTKSKIPSKTKTNIKRKNSTTTAKDSNNTSPDNIKGDSKTVIQSNEKNNTKQPQNASTQRKNSFDNQRKKSITTPFGLLASSNVKNLQKEFLNKSNSSTTTTTATKIQSIKPKPSKLVPPKILTKDQTAPTFANKLTKIITPSQSQASTSSSTTKTKEISTLSSLPQRDHSKDIVPEKKYMEHCFSDEYPTTTDDEDEEENNDQNRDNNISTKTTTRSFYIKKQASQESDDETSDVSDKKRLPKVFFINQKKKSCVSDESHRNMSPFVKIHFIQPHHRIR